MLWLKLQLKSDYTNFIMAKYQSDVILACYYLTYRDLRSHDGKQTYRIKICCFEHHIILSQADIKYTQVKKYICSHQFG